MIHVTQRRLETLIKANKPLPTADYSDIKRFAERQAFEDGCHFGPKTVFKAPCRFDGQLAKSDPLVIMRGTAILTVLYLDQTVVVSTGEGLAPFTSGIVPLDQLPTHTLQPTSQQWSPNHETQRY